MSFRMQKCYGCQKEIMSGDDVAMCESCLRASKVRDHES